MNLVSRWTWVLLFLTLSYGFYHFLEGYNYRVVYSIIPFLFAVQITLADSLEEVIMSHVGYQTRWFTFFIAPGTVVHELSHMFAAIFTGARVTKVNLFRPNPKTGVLGFVNFVQPLDSVAVLRDFLIGFAPFFGCGFVFLVFNLFFGGQLWHVAGQAQIFDLYDFRSFTYDVNMAMVSSAAKLNYRSLFTYLVFYLQFCFLVGAAPSSVDFKGAFKALTRSFSGTISFLVMLAFFFIASQNTTGSGMAYTIAYYIGYFLKLVVVILLLSNVQLFFAIPAAYLAIQMSQIKGIVKTIPVTSSFLAFYLLAPSWGFKSSFAVAFTILVSTLVFLKNQDTFLKQQPG